MEVDSIYGYDFIIIDIRDEHSFKENHLNNSINISLYKLLANYEKILDKNKNYLLICEYGLGSKKVMNMLNKMGYHTFSLKNGYNSLINNKRGIKK